MLKLEDVNVFWGPVHALKGVTIEVREGELVTMLGANGAGKSTTLMTVSGIVRPRGGRVTYEGRDLGRTSAYDIVQHGHHPVPGRTAHLRRPDRAGEPVAGRGAAPRPRATSAGTWNGSSRSSRCWAQRLSQTGATLSGGEQQMLAIGRALDGEPATADAGRALAGTGPSDRGHHLRRDSTAARSRA